MKLIFWNAHPVGVKHFSELRRELLVCSVIKLRVSDLDLTFLQLLRTVVLPNRARGSTRNAGGFLVSRFVRDRDIAARFVADSEAIYSYEGTREINSLIVGLAITGESAFAGPLRK